MTDNEQKIFDVLKEILEREFEIPADKINPEARLYEDLDIDSIDAVDMIVQLRPYLGDKRVTPEDFKQVRTVGDAAKVVAKLLESAPAAEQSEKTAP